MAQSSVSELIALQNIVNETMRARSEFLAAHPLPPLPPITRSQRIRRRVKGGQEDLRERVALWLAPWLERD